MAAKRKKVRRSIPKKVYNIAPEIRCGWPLDDGTPCIAARIFLENGERGPRCRNHKDHDPDQMQLERLVDLKFFVADTAKRASRGLIDAKDAQAVAALCRILRDTMIAMEKLDPEKVAKRVLSYEEMVQRAKEMTVDEARGIAEQRNRALLEDMLHVEDVTNMIQDLEKTAEEVAENPVPVRKKKIRAPRRRSGE